MGQDDILYTDETKLKDLTVGQLKDIIIEIINSSSFIKYEIAQSNRYNAFNIPAPYTDPNTHIYCETDNKIT